MDPVDRLIRDTIIFSGLNPHATEQQIRDFGDTRKLEPLIDVEPIIQMSAYMRCLGDVFAHQGLPQPEWNLFRDMAMEFDKLVDSISGLRDRIIATMETK